ncbi:MAG: hypothetical protein KME25_33750 [Symplocastrum torsivum CPER-KK1]|uniref:Uncharacterized protein n=1 Tax=Symplocastrum torsivum CPER-KK1 TaxID=450513 RepID=A0A951PSX8_9CYAN|nr:hypothetical protein [Symplocastrum torsivum CPER-KK1]
MLVENSYLAVLIKDVSFNYKSQLDICGMFKAIAFFVGVELSALNHLLLDGLLLPLPASIKQRLKGN